MHKSQKSTGRSAVFYRPVGGVTELRAGYLYKSPPQKRLKTERSWKKRYFVLFKLSEQEYQLKYFRSPEEKDRPLGGIDLTQISLLYVSPQNHPRWTWVQRSFKCSADCVLYIRAGDRDYFLVGENSDEVDAWFSDVFEVLKNRPHKFLSSEEINNEQPSIEVISQPYSRRKQTTAVFEKPELKIRSMSDPSSQTSDTSDDKIEKPKQVVDHPKRRASEPVNPIYDYPRVFLRQLQDMGNGERNLPRSESLYETMDRIRQDDQGTQALDHEVEETTTGNLMSSINQTFDKQKVPYFPMAPFSEETAGVDSERMRATSDFSSSSSDNGAMSPVHMLDTPKEPTLMKQCSIDSVSGWTGQPQSVCLFHKGDQILAINDLHTSNVEEFNMFINKSLKNEVKVTILRLPGCQRLHCSNCHCSDSL